MFNYKDLTYLRLAVLSRVEKLSSVDEDDPGIDEDRFTEIQDDIQHLNRLRDTIDREILRLRSPSEASDARLRVVPIKGTSD